MSSPISPWMNAELLELRDLAAKFFSAELAPHAQRFAEQHHVDRELWNRAGELGLLCMSIPEEYGGGGGTFAHEAVVLEEQARIGDSSWGAGLHSGIVAHYILQYATEELRAQWLPKMASGEMIGAIAMTEPGTGSDLQSVKTKALLDGDEYVITGSKTFITNGQQADLIIVVAKTDPSQGAAGISLIVVEADRAGFRRGKVLDKIGQRGQDTSELFFQDVRVPKESLLGEEGMGFVYLMQELPQERLYIATAGTADMESILQQTVDYVKERKAFGQPIANFQNTQFKLAQLDAEITAMRVFVDRCVELLVQGKLDAVTASKAKMLVSDLQCKVIDECLQLHGGYGYMWEYPVTRAYADARIQRIYGGTSEVMKLIIGRDLLSD